MNKLCVGGCCLNPKPTHGHGLLVVHCLEIVQESTSNAFHALVYAIFPKMACVEVCDFPPPIGGVLEFLHGVEAHGVDQPRRCFESSAVFVIDTMIHFVEPTVHHKHLSNVGLRATPRCIRWMAKTGRVVLGLLMVMHSEVPVYPSSLQIPEHEALTPFWA